jgi:signal recognition particle GTPase
VDECKPLKLGQQIEVPVFDMGTDTSPPEIARMGLEMAGYQGQAHDVS